MKKDVMLHVVTKQETLDGDDEFDVRTVGTFAGDDENYEIVYMETDEALDGCETTIKVENSGENVSIVRCGDYEMQLILEKNKRNTSSYTTPHGEFLLGVFAQKMHSNIKDGTGTLRLHYTLDVNAGLVNVSDLTLTVQEVNACQN